MDELTRLSHKLAETLYKGAAPPPPDQTAPGGEAGPKGGEDVVDAEYTVKH
jgi:hypothetical protein